MNWKSALSQVSVSARSLGRYQRALKALQWLDGYSPTLLNLDLVLTWRCNLACPMCNLRQPQHVDAFAPHQGQLTPAEWRAVLDDVRQSFPLRPNINLLGGEPTLYPGFLEVAAYAKQLGLRCTFVTNGTRLERLAEPLVAMGLDVVVVSLDGAEAVHDGIRGEGVFTRAVEGIRALQAARVKAKVQRPQVFLSTAVSAASAPWLHQVPDVAHDLGIAAITFLHLQFFDDELPTAEGAGHGVDSSALLQEMGRVAARARELGVRAHFYPALRADQVGRYYLEPYTALGRDCLSPWLRMSILPDGSVVPCLTTVLGHVGQGTSLRTMWNGPEMRAFRQHLARQGITAACGRCCRRLY